MRFWRRPLRRRKRTLRSLADVQEEFAAALRDPGVAPPAGLVGPDAGPAPRRFAVYRNNVIVGLVNALRSSFPVVERIVGENFFQAMARAFVLYAPPRSPVLTDYGTTFADFIAGFGPATEVPYLPDVARIERAWREAYHAADAVPVAANDFAALGADDIPGLVLKLHPSLRTLRSAFPAQTIWRMHAGDAEIRPVDLSVAEDTLIVRPDAEVEVRSVPPGGAAFVAALASGDALGVAAGKALAADERFDLAGNLAGLIGAGAIVGFVTADRSAPT